MKKSEYIAKHPKSMLAARLEACNWPDNAEIEIIGGLNAPYNKCSNLYKALQASAHKTYCLGGHRKRGTEGWQIAVY